jgi:hypothetical protein
MYFYNFTNCRFHILEHQLGNSLENYNYIDQKYINFKLHIQQNRNIFVILYVYILRWPARPETCSDVNLI